MKLRASRTTQPGSLTSLIFLSTALCEPQEAWIHYLDWSTIQEPTPVRKDFCQSFNDQFSVLPASNGPLSISARPTQCSAEKQRSSYRLRIPSGVPSLSTCILPLLPTQIALVDLIFHISHLTFRFSVSTVLFQREKSSHWEAYCPQSGREKQTIRHNCLTKCIYEHHWNKCLPIITVIIS